VTTSHSTPGSVARGVHDRIDVLLLGRSAAARHRVTRLLDPAQAAADRAEAYRRGGAREATSGPQTGPLRLSKVAQERLGALLGTPAEQAGSVA